MAGADRSDGPSDSRAARRWSLRKPLRTCLLIAQRELWETLRDGRVLGIFLFPLVLYPVMLWGVTQYTLLTSGGRGIVLAWEGDPHIPEWFADAEVEWVPGGQAVAEAGEADGWVRAEETWDRVVFTGEVPDLPGGPDGRLRDAVRDIRKARAADIATVYSAPAAPSWDVELLYSDSEEFDLGEALSELEPLLPALPGLAIVLLATMALYPTLDAAAERERSTLTTSLVSAGGPGPLVWGKLLSITALSLLAVTAQGLAITITFAHLFAVVVTSLGADFVVVWPAPPSPWPLLLGLGVFASAGLLVGSVFLLAMLPWRTAQSAESAGSVAMTALLAAVGTSAAFFDPSPWLPLVNTVSLCTDGLTGELTLQTACSGALVNVALAAVLAEASRRVVMSERFRA